MEQAHNKVGAEKNLDCYSNQQVLQGYDDEDGLAYQSPPGILCRLVVLHMLAS